jgi:hypothetical protein
MQQEPNCFFCGYQSAYLPSKSGKDLVGLSCKRCGDYYLDGLLAASGESIKEESKKILSGYARWEKELRNSPPEITADNEEVIVQNNKDYSDETKVDKLLIYYSKKYPYRGSNVEFISDIDYPITFSKNTVEFVYLLEKFADESLGYIKMLSITSGGPPEGYFQILPRGWERIDWLKKIKLADDKCEIEKDRILSSLTVDEMQMKEQANLNGSRRSSGLARKLKNLYLQGSLNKLDHSVQVDREIIFGEGTRLDKSELEFLRKRVIKVAEIEKAFLEKKLSEIYRDCHAFESFFNVDIAGVLSEIDIKSKSISINLEAEGLLKDKSIAPELPEIHIEELIKMEESSTLEFKSTFQWDVKQERKNEELRKEVIRTLAAFNNTEGGYLVIGVSDGKDIFGLEKDYGLLKHPNKRDFFLQTLCNVVENAISKSFATLIDIEFHEIKDKDICRIKVKSGVAPVVVKESSKDEVLYIRVHNSEKRLSLSETLSYMKTRWK